MKLSIYFLLQLCVCMLHGECSLSETEQEFIWYVLTQQFYTKLLFWELTWLLHEILLLQLTSRQTAEAFGSSGAILTAVVYLN